MIVQLDARRTTLVPNTTEDRIQNNNTSLQITPQTSTTILVNLLTRKAQCREGLCSNDNTSQLEIPHTTRKTFAARAFSVLGPQLWHQLPKEIQGINSYTIFNKNLKNFLYRKAFSGQVGLAN